jgi:hypothetical protein
VPAHTGPNVLESVRPVVQRRATGRAAAAAAAAGGPSALLLLEAVPAGLAQIDGGPGLLAGAALIPAGCRDITNLKISLPRSRSATDQPVPSHIAEQPAAGSNTRQLLTHLYSPWGASCFPVHSRSLPSLIAWSHTEQCQICSGGYQQPRGSFVW